MSSPYFTLTPTNCHASMKLQHPLNNSPSTSNINLSAFLHQFSHFFPGKTKFHQAPRHHVTPWSCVPAATARRDGTRYSGAGNPWMRGRRRIGGAGEVEVPWKGNVRDLAMEIVDLPIKNGDF